jgi:hypothetical protein
VGSCSLGMRTSLPCDASPNGSTASLILCHFPTYTAARAFPQSVEFISHLHTGSCNADVQAERILEELQTINCSLRLLLDRLRQALGPQAPVVHR